MGRSLADAVVVSGVATGKAPDPACVREAAEGARGAPVYLGSGVSVINASTLLAHAHGAIVGSSLKRNGVLDAPVDTERVQALRRALDAMGRRS